jgi:cell division protein FtsI (penicillin-binding protein 3)
VSQGRPRTAGSRTAAKDGQAGTTAGDRKAGTKRAFAKRAPGQRGRPVRRAARGGRPAAGGPVRRTARLPTHRPSPPAEPRRRLRVALMVLMFILTIFGGRLVQMQGLDGKTTALEALRKRSATESLPAHRGDVTDIHGEVLATSVDRRDILVDQTLVRRYKRTSGARQLVGVRGAAEDLSKVLHLPVGDLVTRLTGTSRGAVLAKGVTPEVARAVLRSPVPGVAAYEASRRDYPAGNTAANLLGFVSSSGQAFGGVESAFNEVLAGRAGWMTYERGRDGTRIPTGLAEEVEPRPGGTVRLTIDRDLQYQAQQLLERQVKATSAVSGDVVVLDAKTFEVLALATAPTFDPNRPTGDVANQRNRPLLDVFEPGSTSKVVTMAAALEERVATPATRVAVPNRLVRAGTTFRDSEDHGTEKLTVAGIMAQSSNIGTILTGEKIQPERMYGYLRGFGFGSRTGVELPEVAGELAPPDRWSGSQRYTVLYGQGVSMTALQAAGVFATIANDGVRLQPRLVAGVTGPDGAYRPSSASPATRVVGPETARSVRLMMENVVGEHGTAEKARVPGFRVAGKTGTAAAYDRTCSCYKGYTASFIGMAPADDPRVVIAVILQQPTKGHYGGEVAAPLFRQLMTYTLLQRKVPPTGTTAPEIPLTWRTG